MLAWVMNMGFAASQSGAVVSTAVPFYAMGLSMIRLGGTVFLALILLTI